MDKTQIKSDFKQIKRAMKRGKGEKMDCEKIICDRLKEARAALENGYSEQAEFDAALITMVLDLYEKSEHSPEKATVAKSASVGGIPYADMCHDELRDAAKYHALYEKTKNKTWEYISKQELAHCAAILEMWGASGGDKIEIAAIKNRLMQMDKSIK
ncbi:MAG: hypothetical protein FWC77_01695 [Defluviitaleaceae bacterium]|nr:hypothetical protein [Defluviitaleaceae bacterium]